MDRRRLVRGLTQERQWALVLTGQTLADLVEGARPTGAFLTPDDAGVFWADPFPVRDPAGDLWIFAEEYHRWQGLGRIVALRIDEGTGTVTTRREVLRGRHHYSFPQVHLWDGTWVATAETCDPFAPTYTFTKVGEPWVASLRTLPPGVIDPALSIPKGGGNWYLTGTTGSDEFAGFRQWVAEDGVGFDEQVELRYRDAALARPAGNADAVRGWRSVQDCSDNYGVATSVVRWNPLSVTPGPGEVMRRLTGNDFGHGALGTHTLAWTPDGQTVVADVWRRGRQPVSAAHRVAEQRHGRVCRGRRASRHMP